MENPYVENYINICICIYVCAYIYTHKKTSTAMKVGKYKNPFSTKLHYKYVNKNTITMLDLEYNN